MSGLELPPPGGDDRANASLISNRSTSPTVMPLRSSSFWVAGIGPGEHDHRVDARRRAGRRSRAVGSRPSASAFSRAISSTAAAPSEICDELPAVTLPSSLKAGFSAASFSSVVSGRMPWSATADVAVDPNRDDLALEAALLGRAVGELVRAQAELVHLRARDLPLLGDQLGATGPAGRSCVALHQLRRERRCRRSPADVRRPSGCGPCARRPRRSITSCGARGDQRRRANTTACWPDPHWRSTVVAGTSTGRPACSQALRAMLFDCSPTWVTAPATTSSTSAGSMPAALDDRPVGGAEQLVGVDVLVVALLRVAAADRRARRLDDDDFTALQLGVHGSHNSERSFVSYAWAMPRNTQAGALLTRADDRRARHRRGVHRRAGGRDDRPPGHRPRDEQGRRDRPLRHQGGAAAGRPRARGEVFRREVVEPARSRTRRGANACARSATRWISYLERRVFPGGCFFAAATLEFDDRPGPVRDRLEAGQRRGSVLHRPPGRARRSRRSARSSPSRCTRSSSAPTPPTSCSAIPDVFDRARSAMEPPAAGVGQAARGSGA